MSYTSTFPITPILNSTGLPRPNHRSNRHPQNHRRIQATGSRRLVRQRLLHHHRQLPVNLWQDLQAFPAQGGLPGGHYGV